MFVQGIHGCATKSHSSCVAQVECAAAHGTEAASVIIQSLSSPAPASAVIAVAASLKARGFSTGAESRAATLSCNMMLAFSHTHQQLVRLLRFLWNQPSFRCCNRVRFR
jgi:hypothetical protein